MAFKKRIALALILDTYLEDRKQLGEVHRTLCVVVLVQCLSPVCNCSLMFFFDDGCGEINAHRGTIWMVFEGSQEIVKTRESDTERPDLVDSSRKLCSNQADLFINGGGGKCFVFSQRMGFPLPAAKEWENSTGGVWWAVDWCWL